jgi:hypothetical protein
MIVPSAADARAQIRGGGTAMTRLAVAAFLVVLAGCAGTESPATQSARNVCAIAYGDPALEPIRQRIPLDDDAAIRAAMTFLADTGKPTDAERQALQVYDSANRRCWDAWDQAGRSPTIQSARAAVSAALAELVIGRITYGEFNRRRATALADMRTKLREAEDRERAAYYSRSRPPMFCQSMGRGPFPTVPGW